MLMSGEVLQPYPCHQPLMTTALERLMTHVPAPGTPHDRYSHSRPRPRHPSLAYLASQDVALTARMFQSRVSGISFDPHTGGYPLMASEHVETDEDFIWRQGRAVVALSWESGQWQVSYLVTSRLLGPRQMLYQRIHKDPKLAAWDVMARVIVASHNEQEGVDAARHAVQWMKRRAEWSEMLPRA